MAKRIPQRKYEEALAWLRDNGFETLNAPGTNNRVFLNKYNCSAAIERAGDGTVKLFAYPGCLIGGEISKLVHKGYQQFFKTSKKEVPATADKLRDLHRFTEELKEGTGAISLYNESLGTVSENYVYDRVNGRELPPASRPKRPWEQKSEKRESKKPA